MAHVGDFLAVASGAPEGPPYDGESDYHYAQRLAMQKAEAALEQAGGRVVIAADTIVVLDGEVLGKPRDDDDARRMLGALRDRTHKVITGVGIAPPDSDTITGASEETIVTMRAYRDREIEAYIATGDPRDKAGAYAIQHAQFQPVESISGCYLNVVGFPVCLVQRLIAGASPAAPDPSGRDPNRCDLCRHYAPPTLKAYAAFL